MFAAYNLPIEDWVDLFRRLQAPIRYPDGMVTSLGILYWMREDQFNPLHKALPVLKAASISRFSDLQAVLKTPGLARKFTQSTAIPADLLRALKHDIDLWLPKVVPLTALELLNECANHLPALAQVGIWTQLDILDVTRTPTQRNALSLRTRIPVDALTIIARCCDIFRTGANLNHIRMRIYYSMGWNTWQKWANSTSEEIIHCFAEYIQTQPQQAERLIPWPKEVRNGIEWARLHISVYRMEW